MIDIYQTNNLNLAAFLYASNLKFLGAVKNNHEFIFKFSQKEEAEKLINDYFMGTAMVNPKELFSRLNDLRDFIFNKANF